MRKSTLIWMFLAAVASVLLFHTSQQVLEKRARVADLSAATAREKESLHVLKAEWSYLNQPERLEKLAAENLDLTPATAEHMVKVADLDAALAAPPPPAKPVTKAVPQKPKPKTVVIKKPAPPPPARPKQPAIKNAHTATPGDFSALMSNLGVRR
ncbi:MAG: hypothetical protein OXT65_04425 [Alphaproteobacteria bacterium]|nr:hypothetical protein [Alphaproteobacteria bacterium]